MVASVEELIQKLDNLGVRKTERNKWLSDNTKYSRTQVQDIMAGRKPLSERFWKLACHAIDDVKGGAYWVDTERAGRVTGLIYADPLLLDCAEQLLYLNEINRRRAFVWLFDLVENQNKGKAE